VIARRILERREPVDLVQRVGTRIEPQPHHALAALVRAEALLIGTVAGGGVDVAVGIGQIARLVDDSSKGRLLRAARSLSKWARMTATVIIRRRNQGRLRPALY
jgi:hypothetical protein